MIKSTLKKKEVSSKNGTHNKCITKNKTISLKDQCKENTKQQFNDSKLGKFVCNNLITVKLNKKLLNTDNIFKLNIENADG